MAVDQPVRLALLALHLAVAGGTQLVAAQSTDPQLVKKESESERPAVAASSTVDARASMWCGIVAWHVCMRLSVFECENEM